MVTDREVRRLMELLGKGMSLVTAAAKADMDEKTARKYRSLGKMPHELRGEHFWRTRDDCGCATGPQQAHAAWRVLA